MLDKAKAVSVVERIGEVIGTRLAPGGQAFKPEYLERLSANLEVSQPQVV